MATVVKMPKWGLTMTVGTVTDWLIEEGSSVAAGDPLFTVETEKAVNDVEAPTDGVVVKIVAATGSEVPVSDAVAILAAPGESLSDDEIAALVGVKATSGGRAAAGRTVTARAARTAPRDQSGRINASPAARRRAAELDIDLSTIEATGPDGRITSDDVERAAASQNEDPTPRESAITLPDGRSLNALFAGAGPGLPLVFLHGLGGSQSTWQVVLADLVDNHRTVSIDLPGHGASDRSPDADYSNGGLASAISEAIKATGIKRPIVVGHSLGGAVALSIAATDPGSIAGVVAIDSAGLGAEGSAELWALMMGSPGPETARGLLELFYRDTRLVNERGVQEMAQSQMAEGAWPAQQAVARAAFEGATQLDTMRADPGSVSVPVLLIWGEDDRVLPVRHAYDTLSSFPDAELAIISGTGHVPQIENAARTAQLIGRFARGLG